MVIYNAVGHLYQRIHSMSQSPYLAVLEQRLALIGDGGGAKIARSLQVKREFGEQQLALINQLLDENGLLEV